MAGIRITQQFPHALPGRRYGSFADKSAPEVALGSYYRLINRWWSALHFRQNESVAARRRFPLFLVDATTGLVPATGEMGGQPQVSKNGATWVNTQAVLVHVGNGFYYVQLAAGELDTAGRLLVRYKSGGTAEFAAAAVVRDPGAALAGEVWTAPERLLTLVKDLGA